VNTHPSMSTRIVCAVLESDLGTGTNSFNNSCLSEGRFLGLITQIPARETSGSGEQDAVLTAQFKPKPPGIVTQNNFIDVCGRCYDPGFPHVLWVEDEPMSSPMSTLSPVCNLGFIIRFLCDTCVKWRVTRMATCTEIPTNVNYNTLSSSEFREVAAALDNNRRMMGRGGFIHPVNLHWHHTTSVSPRQFAVVVSTFGAQSNLSSLGRLLRSFPLNLHRI